MQAALPCVLPWTMVNHFNTRTFATACLVTLWRECERSALRDVIKQHAIVNSVVEFHIQNSSKLVCMLLHSCVICLAVQNENTTKQK